MLPQMRKILIYGVIEVAILVLIIVLFLYTDKSVIPICLFTVVGLLHIGCSLWSINDLMDVYINKFGQEVVGQAVDEFNRDIYRNSNGVL